MQEEEKITKLELLNKELERLHKDYQEADPWRKDDILKVIQQITNEILERQ
jgi:hypothetical protein